MNMEWEELDPSARCAGTSPRMTRGGKERRGWRIALKLEARRQGHAAGDAAHLLLHRLLDLGPRVVGCGHDQVLDHALVGRHEQRGVDLDLARLVLAVDGHLDQAGAGAADDLQALERGLQLLHLLLHGLRLLHQAAQILEFVEHQNSLSGMSSSAGYSSAAGGSSPAPARPATRDVWPPLRRTASSLAPGNVFRMACTIGSASAWLRSESDWAAFWTVSVGLPGSLDTEAIQRRPVQRPSISLRRDARSGGACGSGRNSIRPGSQRNSCTWCSRWCTRRASRRASNRATISVKLLGLGSASAGWTAVVATGCVASRAAAPPPPRGADVPAVGA